MALILKLESHVNLPGGGPVTFAVPVEGGVEIGRSKFVDWTLPDTSREVSSRHCQIKFQDGVYLLIDYSTNGTFVNGAATRVQSPYRLADGDRLKIGAYVVSVALTAGGTAADPAPEGYARPRLDRNRDDNALWDVDGDIAPPSDPKDLRPKGRPAPIYGDFLTFNVNAPRISDAAQFTPAASAFDPPSPERQGSHAQDSRIPEPRRRAPPADSVWMTGDTAAAAQSRVQPLVQASPIAAETAVAAPSDHGAAFLRGFMAAAGLTEMPALSADPEQFGAFLGGFVLTVAAEMQVLLRARGEAKLAARSGEHTMIRAEANNPLKFTPTPEEALRVMFGVPTRAYLDAPNAVQAGFRDLKRHQLQTFAAMQEALRRLIEDISPDSLEAKLEAAHGPAALFEKRKTRLWEAYVAAWQSWSHGRASGLIDSFMIHFGEFYDRVGADENSEG